MLRKCNPLFDLYSSFTMSLDWGGNKEKEIKREVEMCEKTPNLKRAEFVAANKLL